MISLSMLKEIRSKFDVIISDVHMPQMDGFKIHALENLEMDVLVISRFSYLAKILTIA